MANKFIIAGIIFTSIILTGFWLSHIGKPFNVLLLTVHKLISVGMIVLIGISVFRINKAAPLSALEIAVCAITLLLFLALISTGGILSASKTTNYFILTIHKYCPVLVVASTALTIYLLMNRKL